MNVEMSRLREATATLNLPPPVPLAEVERLEVIAGFRLPPILREIYLSIANGGFGPGYGLLALTYRVDVQDETVLELFQSFNQPDPDDPGWSWPKYLLPINDWGCAIRSCVDCRGENGPIIRFDPNGHGPGVSWKTAYTREYHSVNDWLVDWASGTLPIEI